MKIIAGLGNPGVKYETTRHNAGFLALDRMVEAWKASGPSNKAQSEVYQAIVGGEKVILMKPQTFMNESGKAVGELFRLYKCEPKDLLVIHDEIDLPPLTLRLKTGGGTGGNNGLKSIDAHLGGLATGYHRIRIGVGHPARIPGKAMIQPADWVLGQFSDEELGGLDPLLDRVVQAAEMILRGEIGPAMTEFNRGTA